ncbi:MULTISPECIES: competence protein CoiA [Geobacillus]|nr:MULTISPECIES: competence protein CoiA family protein [Geobacillus]AGE21305.1 competence protein [Geobacillus sp. GHH01]OQP15756.1 competence protein CoiA [Geobacillus zalihae]QNU24282.1 competence protein CoiA [Geobacillus zalihae]
MLFVALSADGRTVSLAGAERWEREGLMRLKRQEPFFCPACRQEVVLRSGRYRLPHFAHRKGAACPVEHEPESERHLTGKRDLFAWLIRQGMEAKLEPYLPAIKQRPDILFRHGPHLYALEYQCSTIDESLFRERNDGYRLLGIRPLWVLGAHHLRRSPKYSGEVQLSRFQWLFAHRAPHSVVPHIWYYSPETKRFIRLFRPLPLSVQRTFAAVDSIPLSSFSFPDWMAPCPLPLSPTFWERWLERKKQWRRTFPLYPNQTVRRICADFYQAGIVPSLFPTEAGWPVPRGYLWETAPFIWQTYVLLFLLGKTGRPATAVSLFQWLDDKIRTGRLVPRRLPLVGRDTYREAVGEYLHWLSLLGYLRREEGDQLHLVKPLSFPSTVDQMIHQDAALLEQIHQTPALSRYWEALEFQNAEKMNRKQEKMNGMVNNNSCIDYLYKEE